jgi:hypothetical protein
LPGGFGNVDDLIVAPGLVYRRDAVDRNHVGEPHQVGLWRIRSTPTIDDADMLMVVGLEHGASGTTSGTPVHLEPRRQLPDREPLTAVIDTDLLEQLHPRT